MGTFFFNNRSLRDRNRRKERSSEKETKMLINKGHGVSFRNACVSLFIASLLAMVAFISWQESLAAVQDSYRNHQKRSLDKEATTTQEPMTAKILEDNQKSKSHDTKKSSGRTNSAINRRRKRRLEEENLDDGTDGVSC